MHLAQAAQDVESEAQGHLHWAWALYRLSNTKAAQLQCEQALALSQAVELYDTQATSLRLLGLINCQGYDPAKARTYFEQALGICRKTGDRRGEGAKGASGISSGG